jgi:multidrug efflux pump subunit AcrA (membrane-fusion protein)
VLVPIAAPRRGVVVRRSLEAGAQVGASAEILALVTPDAVVFEAHVPAAQAERLRVGQPATITVEGRSPCPAVLQRVLPVAGGSDQSTLVWLATTEPVVGFELERFGTASIQLGPERSALAVPDSAVVEDDLTAATRVAVVRDRKQAVWTTVHLGAAAGGWRELKPPGLPPGTLVVTEGQRGLPDSAAVAVEP